MSRKLLIADDSVTIQRVIELTFSGEDVQVVAVGDGEQAIARIPVEKPDIVLADIAMPKRNGYEVAAFVKNHPELSHVPVLLLSGAFEPVDEARAEQVKCDGVLVKPFEPQQVIARVRELMNGVAVGETKAGSPGTLESTLAKPEPGPAGPEPAKSAPEPVYTPPAPVKTGPEPEPMASSESPPPAVEAPRLPASEIGVASAEGPTTSLDAYFDQLDAAFATLGSTPAADHSTAPPRSLEDEFLARVPTVDDVLSGASLRPTPDAPAVRPGHMALPPPEPPDASATLSPAPHGATSAEAAGAAGENGIARLFNLLLAVERGEAEAPVFSSGATAASSPAPLQLTDELIDQIARRVLERLGPDTARTLVADIVSDTAERLVREEIDRIRNAK